MVIAYIIGGIHYDPCNIQSRKYASIPGGRPKFRGKPIRKWTYHEAVLQLGAFRKVTLLSGPGWRNDKTELRPATLAGEEVALDVDPSSAGASHRARSLDDISSYISRSQSRL